MPQIRPAQTLMRLLGWLACAGAVGLLVAAMAMAADPAAAAVGARVTGAWVRLAAVPGRPAAGYFTLTAGAAPATLTAVTTPSARVELHDMTMAGGVMHMATLPTVRAVAGHPVRFAPGAAHLMLFDVAASLRPGATLPLIFAFADGTRLRVDAAVVAAGAETAGPAMAKMPGMTGRH